MDYFGFDISARMVEPLLQDPPAGLASELHHRIRIAPTLAEAFNADKFDVIFTISVLIHNNREQADEILAQMRGLLAPDGRLCFIENRPVSISLLANLWHAGCWSHDIAGTLAPDMNVDVEDGILSDQAIYILSEPASAPRQLRVPGNSGFEPISPGDFLLRTQGATTAAARNMENENATIGDQVARMRDALELHRASDGRALHALQTTWEHAAEPDQAPADVGNTGSLVLAAPHHPAALVDELERRLASQQQELERATSGIEQAQRANRELLWQQGLREKIRSMTRAGCDIASPEEVGRAAGWRHNTPVAPAPVYEFNARRDTRFAQALTGQERVCHVLHQEWFGIRAACGALPGQKLAVSGSVPPTLRDFEDAARLLAAIKIERLVIHGFSDSMYQWVKGLAAAGFDRMYLVWHGAPVMWVHPEERRLFALAYKAFREGLIRKVSGMRPGTHAALPEAASWNRQVYNMPPNYSCKRAPRRHTAATVFIPSWNLIHKNIFTNAAAAAATDEVANLWLMADDFELPYKVDKCVNRLPKLSQLQMMETMSQVDVVMNASIVDCHPMVELESLAAGTPALRGRLGMDALEDHPYVLATQVDDALSVDDVRRTLRRILSTPAGEMDEMMRSYSERLVSLSLERYSELMEL